MSIGKMKRVFCVMAAAMMLFAAGCESLAPEETPAQHEDAGSETAAGGIAFSAADQYGNVVDAASFAEYDLILMNFWAFWCGPCLDEMPSFETLREEYPNVLFLGVIVDDSMPEMTQAAIEATGVRYSVILPDGDLEERVNAMDAIPVTVFFDRNGLQIGNEILGSRPYEEWKSLIEGFLRPEAA